MNKREKKTKSIEAAMDFNFSAGSIFLKKQFFVTLPCCVRVCEKCFNVASFISVDVVLASWKEIQTKSFVQSLPRVKFLMSVGLLGYSLRHMEQWHLLQNRNVQTPPPRQKRKTGILSCEFLASKEICQKEYPDMYVFHWWRRAQGHRCLRGILISSGDLRTCPRIDV